MDKKVIGIAVAVLLFAAIVPNLTAQTNLVEEDFEGSFPPAGWTTTVAGGGQQWYRNDQAGWWPVTNYTNGTGFCACNDDDYWWSYPQNNALVTPSIDASSYSNLTLEYEFYGHYTWSGYDWLNVEINVGSGWNQIVQYINWSTPNPLSESFDISALADGQSNVQVRFSYTSNSWMYGVQIDDVVISGEGGGPPPEEDTLDLEMTQVVRPRGQEEGGVTFTPACRILNNLDTTAHASVRCMIKDIETQQTVYEDVLSTVPLEFGYNEISAFRDFTPEGNKVYDALFVVNHPDDPNEENNDKTQRFSTAAGMVVDATDILAPDDDQQGPFSPSAVFTAGEETDVTGAMLNCKIEDATYGAVVFEEEKGPVDITAGDSYTETFSEVTDLVDGTAYTITFWATIEKSAAGKDTSMTFNFTEGIAENPVLETFDLTVSANTITYSLGEATNVDLRVYDVAGNVVSTLASGNYSAGSHTVSIDGLGSGVYFVKMVTPFFTDVAKVTVVR